MWRQPPRRPPSEARTLLGSAGEGICEGPVQKIKPAFPPPAAGTRFPHSLSVTEGVKVADQNFYYS